MILVEWPFRFETIELTRDYWITASCSECGFFDSPPGGKCLIDQQKFVLIAFIISLRLRSDQTSDTIMRDDAEHDRQLRTVRDPSQRLAF